MNSRLAQDLLRYGGYDTRTFFAKSMAPWADIINRTDPTIGAHVEHARATERSIVGTYCHFAFFGGQDIHGS